MPSPSYALHNFAPLSLFALLHPYMTFRPLPSSSLTLLITLPAYMSSKGCRVFSCAAPCLSSSLPQTIQKTDSLSTLTSHLESHLDFSDGPFLCDPCSCPCLYIQAFTFYCQYFNCVIIFVFLCCKVTSSVPKDAL